MNIYNNDSITLSNESAEAFLHNLRYGTESLTLRDSFIEGVEIEISDDGNRMEVSIPGLDLYLDTLSESISTTMKAKKPRISITSSVMAKSIHSSATHSYDGIINNGQQQYIISQKNTQTKWNTSVQRRCDAA